MSKPEVHWAYQLKQLTRLNQTIYKMTEELIPEFSTPFQAVLNARASLKASLGFRIPKPVSLIMKLYGLSPGELKLWLDSESGYMVEARVKPGAPPVYHHVSDEVAIKILKGELTHELEAELMTPDPYLGE